jgi:hypothetical protein
VAPLIWRFNGGLDRSLFNNQVRLYAHPGHFFLAIMAQGAGLGSPTGNALSTDIDECATGVINCDTNAACANTPGGFNCTCNRGYTGDGTSCTGKFFS